MILSLDTETTGLDLRHSAKPFFVTTCDDRGEQRYWEWTVNPYTRQPSIPEDDLDEIESLIREAEILILQNSKFDVAALAAVRPSLGEDWPWEKTEDTLLAGHLLASNLPHDLTSMGMQYLGVDILPFEVALNEACEKARRLCRRHLPKWKVAKQGLDGMPSAKEKCWKHDTWLPRAVWKHYTWLKSPEYPATHPWATVLREYSNMDSAITLPLWQRQMAEIKRRGLEAIYRERLKVLPVAYAMESRGVTINRCRLDHLMNRYGEESERAGRVCVDIADNLGHELTLPKNGVNGSLREFCFDVLDLPRVYSSKAKTDGPTLNKGAIEQYLATLPAGSDGLRFVRSLVEKRGRDTAIAYMEGYERFWVPWVPVHVTDQKTGAGWYVLHPNLNPCGTDTLRWSSSNPNEQNISKQGMRCIECHGEGCNKCDGKGTDPLNLRYCFGPAPGREWWSLDAKNIELRIPAYESGERDVIDLFERPDDPPYYGSTHLLNFHTVYPDLWGAEMGKVCDKCCKGKTVDETLIGPHCKKKFAATWYQWCKNGGFKIQYGGVNADDAFHRKGAHAMVTSRFSKLDNLNQQQIRYANKYGYVETMPDKTVDPNHGYPVMCTRMDSGRILPTVPLNYRVQSTAMWWMARAMVRVHAFFQGLNAGESFGGRLWPGGYYLVLQVHDELVPDMPSGMGKGKQPYEYNLPIVREVQRLMEIGGEGLGVPTPVGVEYHAETWGEGVTL